MLGSDVSGPSNRMWVDLTPKLLCIVQSDSTEPNNQGWGCGGGGGGHPQGWWVVRLVGWYGVIAPSTRRAPPRVTRFFPHFWCSQTELIIGLTHNSLAHPLQCNPQGKKSCSAAVMHMPSEPQASDSNQAFA